MSAAAAAVAAAPVLIVESITAANVRSSGYTLISLYKDYMETKDVETQFQLKVSIKSEYKKFLLARSAYDAEVALDATKKSIGFRTWLTRNNDALEIIEELVHDEDA